MSKKKEKFDEYDSGKIKTYKTKKNVRLLKDRECVSLLIE